MPLEIHDMNTGTFMEVHVSGKLTKGDYETFVPEVERLIREHGKLRVLFDMQDFHGWDVSALWDDIKFDLRHFRDIGRLALVGDRKWEAGMALFCRPFTTATMKYFDRAQLAEARDWIAHD